MPLVNTLKYFRILFRIRGDIWHTVKVQSTDSALCNFAPSYAILLRAMQFCSALCNFAPRYAILLRAMQFCSALCNFAPSYATWRGVMTSPYVA
jgi:hypothetical protein